MDQYLYPWQDASGDLHIGSIKARNYTDCLEKLSKHLISKYDKLDDTLEFEDLLEQLGELYCIFIGDIYDITEF